jgi:guanylate kinase
MFELTSLANGAFGIPCARFGTGKDAIFMLSDSGRVPILDINTDGVRKAKLHGMYLDPLPFFIYIKPPSMKVLEDRIRISRANQARAHLGQQKNLSNNT